jgi:hypothetical protein
VSAATEVRTRPLEVLTDEELAVLTTGPGVVVTPYLDTVAEEAHDAVRRTALRSLVARGLVDLPEDSPTAEPGAVLVREDVRSALTLREAARTVIAVARTATGSQDFWYAHLVREVVLLEEVGPDGLHRFALARAEDLGDLLVAAAITPGAADGSGEAVHLDAEVAAEPPPALVARLGEAHLRADVVKVGAGPVATPSRTHQPVLTGVWTGPLGSWSVVADPVTASVSAHPRTVGELDGRLRDLAREAVEEQEGMFA